ncbi:MAG: hypothetical protein IPM29_07490 [Planctomycetes bacterium]|nr:hypothetical protein [Planctomycetota bacterium]
MLGADLLIDLTRRYCEPHRRYHTIEHIASMLWMGRELALSEEQLAAIWYHDAIYDVPATDNEERSAELARTQLTAAGFGIERAATVARIVLDTARHLPSIPQSEAVIDLDLAPLAVPPERFDANAVALRIEYACVDDATFEQGRRRALQSLLDRPRIFWTPFGAHLEPLARANLRRALAAPGPTLPER